MSSVNITGIQVLNNEAPWNTPFQFEVSFEALVTLKEDLEWTLTYVGSAESSEHDQLLESVLLGPITAGQFKFVFQADAPKLNSIPAGDILGVTVLLLSCSYKNAEFVRVGYYVKNFYKNEELANNPPARPQLDDIHRTILADEPRVTYFPNNWDRPVNDGPTVFPEPVHCLPTEFGDADPMDEDDYDDSELDDESEDLDEEEESDQSSESLGSEDDMNIDQGD